MFVVQLIFAPFDPPRNVSWDNCYKACGEETSSLAPELLGEEVGGDGGEAGEEGGEEDADVPDVDGDVEHAQDVVDAPAGQHQTRVHCAADNSVKRGYNYSKSIIKNCL